MYHPHAPLQDEFHQNSGIVLCYEPSANQSGSEQFPKLKIAWSILNGDQIEERYVQWRLKANTTWTVTFQLYINSKGGFSRTWKNNDLEVLHVTESSYPTRIPQPEDTASCYGIRILQHMMVYETLDGWDAVNHFGWLATTSGALYTFMLGVFVSLAMLCNKTVSLKTNVVRQRRQVKSEEVNFTAQFHSSLSTRWMLARHRPLVANSALFPFSRCPRCADAGNALT